MRKESIVIGKGERDPLYRRPIYKGEDPNERGGPGERDETNRGTNISKGERDETTGRTVYGSDEDHPAERDAEGVGPRRREHVVTDAGGGIDVEHVDDLNISRGQRDDVHRRPVYGGQDPNETPKARDNDLRDDSSGVGGEAAADAPAGSGYDRERNPEGAEEADRRAEEDFEAKTAERSTKVSGEDAYRRSTDVGVDSDEGEGGEASATVEVDGDEVRVTYTNPTKTAVEFHRTIGSRTGTRTIEPGDSATGSYRLDEDDRRVVIRRGGAEGDVVAES